MDEKQITPELVEEEGLYILPPHPEGAAPASLETANPAEPVAVTDSLPDLIQQAVDGLRSELRTELETQVKSLQTGLQAELQAELQKERGGSESNVKN